ncbi:MAG: TonB family protein [Deltaproteobacteria bacterium]|nr:TonB family protein [Deltaproteobacteria bacterium]
MTGRPAIALAALVSGLIHVGVVEFAPRRDPEPPSATARRAKPVPVRALKQQVRLAPDPARAAKVAEEIREATRKVERPKPEPRKKVASLALPPKPATPPPPASPPPPDAQPPKPAPLVLSNVALNGGVAVQTGAESNVLGSAAVDATGWKKPPSPEDAGTANAPVEAPRKVVIRPPELAVEARGRYPDAHRDLSRVVRVQLVLSVDEKGEVRDVEVTKGDLPAFDDEARRTAMRLKFRPATRDGAPIPYKVRWTVTFIPEAD